MAFSSPDVDSMQIIFVFLDGKLALFTTTFARKYFAHYNPQSMAIETAKDLYVANGADLRHWHDVSSDIIKYLKDKLNRAAEAVVYKGVLPNSEAFDNLEDIRKGDTWTNEETGVNLMWNGEEWIPVSLFRMDFDKEAIEGSINGIQSGYIWTALQNFIDDPTIYRIVGEAYEDPELQNALHDISNQLADIVQDIIDLNAKYARIPDPLISTDEGNEIIKGEDGGVFFDSEHCRLAERLERLEAASATSVAPILSDGTPIAVNNSSPDVIYIEADQDVQIIFEPLTKYEWMVKHLYIESLADISVSIENGTFANVEEDPHYGQEGYGMLIRCTWIGGKIILEVLDNSQCAANVSSWKEEPEEPDDQNP